MSRTLSKESERRCDLGTVKITDRDQHALRWISDQYAVRVDTLAWVLSPCLQTGAGSNQSCS